jgi:tetratricopeptide (TPR) repeat protein
MDNKENCIQLKIDSIISDINQNNETTQSEEKNQITALIGYSHCLDLYEFLKLYSKVQKNELLFQIAIIYDSIGYSELSMEYIDQALLLIPNVPSITLYKCGLFANQNKLDEAQKWLLKYKYLIGENKYDNYIHDSFQTIIYYLLEYEEFIILRKISSMEKKYLFFK